MRSATRARLLAAGFALLFPTLASASGMDDLIDALTGQDEQARALARQLLPRHGVGQMPRLFPLLGSENAAIREAAFQVLADLSNEAAAPGKAADRTAATEHLMTLLARDRSSEIQIRGLRLLPIACDEGADVAPVARLLADPKVRERAREALEEIGTVPSRKAIRDFLGKSDPDFDVALLNSLGRLRDIESLKPAAALLESSPPKVRVAAARALAWSGDPAFLPAFRTLAGTVEPPLRPDADDALLRLLDAISRRPDQRPAAVAGYLALARDARGQVKDGALAGLGRLGDPSTIGAILDAIRDEQPPTSAVGLAALVTMPGTEATKALAKAYPSAPAPLRVGLLGVLGARRDPLVLPILEQAAHESNPEYRLSAIQALADSGLPRAFQLLAAEEKQGEPIYRAQVKAIRTRAIEREKARLLERVQSGAAGQAELLGQLGVIGRWWVVGPFDLGEKNEGWETRYIGEPNVNVVARYMAGKVRRQWKKVDSHDSQGRIDLRAAIAERDRCVGYAYAEFELDRALDALLLLGVDDSEKVWVNGEKVFEQFTRRGLTVDQDRVPVKLKAGTNTILLKVYQDQLGWEFCARIVTTDGQAVPLTQKAD